MKAISILIPTYNYVCTELVAALEQQARQLGIGYEIIVADDGSTQTETIQANRAINEYTNCRYIERPENAGRAAIRNYLARQATMPWVLFMDSDMVVRRPDFLRRYAETPDEQAAWMGGITVGGNNRSLRHNLRYRYEKANEHAHTAERRQQAPYQDFHTANFLAPRQLLAVCPFDERFRYYGYEDVLFGKQLEKRHIPVIHLDNPLSFEIFEDNDTFLRKTEEGLRTLYTFRQELKDCSRLLHRARQLSWLMPLLSRWHQATKKLEQRILLRYPSLLLFSLYRLGYFATLESGT